jgi:hypothetical protein
MVPRSAAAAVSVLGGLVSSGKIGSGARPRWPSLLQIVKDLVLASDWKGYHGAED